jgi:hypothetical protein
MSLTGSALPLVKSARAAPRSMATDNSSQDMPPAPAMMQRRLSVMSKGNISATFQVPGVISIPSDGNTHNVTIVELKLDATMSWACVPKKDTKVHLKVLSSSASITCSLT